MDKTSKVYSILSAILFVAIFLFILGGLGACSTQKRVNSPQDCTNPQTDLDIQRCYGEEY
jgi:hypothetical protein